MKICQLIASLEEQYGGPSRSVLSLSTALAELGHDVDLLATHPTTPSTRTAGSLRVNVFQRGWPQQLSPSAALRAHLAKATPAVIHNHGLWLRPLHYAHHRAAALGAPLVISPRGMMSPWAWHHRGPQKRIARRFIHPGALEAAAGWHATSSEEAEDIRALGHRQPVCIAPNGVHAPTAAEIEASAAYWHQVCPATTQRPTAVFYSRFHRKKRVLELIDLWIQRAPPDSLLLMVGIPEDYTPEEIEAYAMRASGGGRVRAFLGVGVPAPYGVASVFLLPSHSENFGLVVAEAMAHGVPAIVTDATPWSMLNSTGHGWCVPWESYGDALVAALSEGPAHLRARGARARDWALAEFSWEKSAATLAAFYTQLQSGKK